MNPRRVWYDASELGISLSLASGASRISRKTADNVVKSFLTRAHQVNEDDRYLYRVTAVVVYWCYLSDDQHLGDADFAIELRHKSSDYTTFFLLSRAKITQAYLEGRSFRNITDEVVWPRNEVRMFLRNRKRSISIQDLQELSQLGRHKPLGTE